MRLRLLRWLLAAVENPRPHIARLVIGATLMGVVAWLASHRVWESRTDEALRHAKNVVASIRSAQERYKAASRGYLHVSSSRDAWYPNAPSAGPPALRLDQANPEHVDRALWEELFGAVDSWPSEATPFRFLVLAGRESTRPRYLPPSLGEVWPRSPDHTWFVVYGFGHVEGRPYLLTSSSVNDEVVVEELRSPPW